MNEKVLFIFIHLIFSPEFCKNYLPTKITRLHLADNSKSAGGKHYRISRVEMVLMFFVLKISLD